MGTLFINLRGAVHTNTVGVVIVTFANPAGAYISLSTMGAAGTGMTIAAAGAAGNQYISITTGANQSICYTLIGGW